MRRRALRSWVFKSVVAAFFAGGGCSAPREEVTPLRDRALATTKGEVDPPSTAQMAADSSAIARGEALFYRYECHACHTTRPATQTPTPVPVSRQCAGCHDAMWQQPDRARELLYQAYGRRVSPGEVKHLRQDVRSLTLIPDLTDLGARVRRTWIADFLRAPADLRTHLSSTMPRLNFKAGEVEALAAYLAPQAALAGDEKVHGNVQRGHELLHERGCLSCHARGDGDKALGSPRQADRQNPLRALAPDLNYAAPRMGLSRLRQWLENPQAIMPNAQMPVPMLNSTEREDVVAALLVLSRDQRPANVLLRLPKVTKKVTTSEVIAAVFRKTCRHCHADPVTARGDGGPGYSGGFGFSGMRLDLSSEMAIEAGYVDAQGQGHSLFERLADGTPRLVAVLLARHDEVEGRIQPGLLGMPLGLPPLPLEDIALVQAWIDHMWPIDAG